MNSSSKHKFGVLLILAAGLLLDRATSLADDLNKCRQDLGMLSGKITDEQISASSAYDHSSVGAHNARIKNDKAGGAWCPNVSVGPTDYEWLQIDLRAFKVITKIETQGRFGNGQGQEYTKFYMVEYQRKLTSDRWKRYYNKTGHTVFEANQNTYTPVLVDLNPPIIARKVRIIPYSEHPRTICMRVELYGCEWKQGVISYSMPQGARRGAEVDLLDYGYDGEEEDGILSGGLGQLVDGEEGDMNFRLDPWGTGKKGFSWIGWKNDSLTTPPVEILFEFDKARNFSSLMVNCNNWFSKDISVFRQARIYFSVGGRYYSKEPVVYNSYRDVIMEYARKVIIPMHHRIGKYLKVQLFFDMRWMMISEVNFLSEIITSNITDAIITEETQGLYQVSSKATPTDDSSFEYNYETETGDDEYHQGTKGFGSNKTDNKKFGESESKNLDDRFIGIIIGALSALILLLFVTVALIILRHRRQKANAQRYKSGFATEHITFNLNDLHQHGGNEKVINGNMYNSVSTHDNELDMTRDSSTSKLTNGDPYENIQGRILPDLPNSSMDTDTMTSREYAVPDMNGHAVVNGRKIPSPMPPKPFQANMYPTDGAGEEEVGPPLPQRPLPAYLPQNGVALPPLSLPIIQGVSGTNMYAVPNAEILWQDDFSVIEFPRKNLEFVEKLGEGQFGEVHLCEATNLAEIMGDNFLVNRGSPKPGLLVAVKTLRSDADRHAREDFQKEVRIMSRLKDPNIVRVLGVCTKGEPMCVVVEYMKFGDLNQVLQSHTLEGTTLARNAKKVNSLSYGALIYIAMQVASGMKYLESLNMVHRDLATRNCLVGALFNIKISDFGMSRDLYSTDYYRIEGKAVLPIRWMAWESVLLGKFSSKSDVWSFAVTLWEILTFAREYPYDGMEDEQVIDNCTRFYRNDGQQTYLPIPAYCPKEIYDLMCECWNREEVQRPAFREIHMFLQRKNMGYNPRDEVNSHVNQPTTLPIV